MFLTSVYHITFFIYFGKTQSRRTNNVMASSTTRTGNSVSLDTFQNWRKENILGYKTFKDSKWHMMVNFIWCKLCAKYEKEIMNSSLIRGNERAAAHSFIDGTNSVTKHQVCIFLKEMFMNLVLSWSLYL